MALLSHSLGLCVSNLASVRVCGLACEVEGTGQLGGSHEMPYVSCSCSAGHIANAQQIVGLFWAGCIRKRGKGESEMDRRHAVVSIPIGTEGADVSPSLVTDWLCDLEQVTSLC